MRAVCLSAKPSGQRRWLPNRRLRAARNANCGLAGMLPPWKPCPSRHQRRFHRPCLDIRRRPACRMPHPRAPQAGTSTDRSAVVTGTVLQALLPGGHWHPADGYPRRAAPTTGSTGFRIRDAMGVGWACRFNGQGPKGAQDSCSPRYQPPTTTKDYFNTKDRGTVSPSKGYRLTAKGVPSHRP